MKTKDKVIAGLMIFTSLICAVAFASCVLTRDVSGALFFVILGFVNVSSYTEVRRGK